MNSRLNPSYLIIIQNVNRVINTVIEYVMNIRSNSIDISYKMQIDFKYVMIWDNILTFNKN